MEVSISSGQRASTGRAVVGLAILVAVWSCGGPNATPPSPEDAGDAGRSGATGQGGITGGGSDAGGGGSTAEGASSAQGGSGASGDDPGNGGTGADAGGGEAGQAASGGETGGSTPTGGSMTEGGSDAEGGTPGGGASNEGGASPGSGGTPAEGGSAGQPGEGGSVDEGGSGGGDACISTCGEPLVIDDFEDGDRDACVNPAWVSNWWLASDGTGLSVPTSSDDLVVAFDPARGTSCGALHLQGSGFTDWGIDFGLSFNDPDQTVPRQVDLSAYSGVTLWVRGSGQVSFQLVTTDTEVSDAGGSCSSRCYDHLGRTITLSASWTMVQVAFSSLSGVLTQTPLSSADLQKALAFYFLLPTTTTFDVWLDDISFY